MKLLIFNSLFFFQTISLFAFNVTFRVDMFGVSGFATPELNGTFNNWCGNCTTMADANGDGIWETTVDISAGTFEYKFSADNWLSQETLTPGSSCTNTAFGFTNRTISISGNTVLPVVCWSSCSACSYIPVTFQVNLKGILGFTAPNVSGNFNDWCGNCNLMTDANGDGIWTTTINLLPGTYEYKFSYDNWAGAENLTPGSTCTVTNSGFTNRVLNLSQSITLPPVCWQTCNAASGTPVIPTVSITQTTGSNPGCKESAVVFTATVGNASSTPYYQWKVNGAYVGSNSPLFESNSLINGQIITCEVTCNCNQTSPVVSNSIVIGILPLVNPAVTISNSFIDPICGGDPISFTAIPTFGGSNPVYQWKVNGVNAGLDSNKLTINGLNANATISCIMTSNAPCQSKPWNLIWSDEFTGTALDLAKWKPEIGGGGWGNNELQYYTNSPNNVSVSNGQLKITARNTGTGNQLYTSARLITKGLFSTKYGKVIGRMKIPIGQGFWPAFWMLGANIDQVSWPRCGEIDIMEHVNVEPKIHGTCHWYNNGRAYYGKSYDLDINAFHDYIVEWDSLSIRFFVDGNQYHQHFISASNGSLEEFTKPFFLLLNVAVGGQWPGSPNGTSIFPASMDVDYVRVYQHESLPIGQVLSNSVSLTLSGINPVTPDNISGDTAVCANQTGLVYSISSRPNETYTWTLPGTSSIQSGQGTASISVNWHTSPGKIKVKASNFCGVSEERELQVGIKICTSVSGSQNFPDVGIYPNPGTGVFNLHSEKIKTKLKTSVYNIFGKLILPETELEGSGTFMLNLEKEPAGVYLVKLQSEGLSDILPVLKK